MVVAVHGSGDVYLKHFSSFSCTCTQNPGFSGYTQHWVFHRDFFTFPSQKSVTVTQESCHASAEQCQCGQVSFSPSVMSLTKCTFLMLGTLSKSCKLKYPFTKSNVSKHRIQKKMTSVRDIIQYFWE